MVRRLARETTMKALFAFDLGKNEPTDILTRLCEEDKIPSEAEEFSNYLLKGVLANRKFLDRVIGKYAIEWKIERIAAVDRNILRIALYELFFSENMPVAVPVNEAIEIAKLYGGDESPRFINGILGKVIKELPSLKSLQDNENNGNI